MSRKSLVRILRTLWRLAPEGDYKGGVRLLWHNVRLAPRARFWNRNGSFVTVLDGVKLSTMDEPFSLLEAADAYQAHRKIGAGDVIIDAGGYHGQLAVYFALRVGAKGKVITCEPDPANVQVLQKNLALNSRPANVIVSTPPLWDKEENIKFYWQGNLASSAYWTPPGATVAAVRTTTIDQLVESLALTRVDFIKMDIEGAEVKAIDGARITAKRFRPSWAIASYHVVNGQATYPQVERGLQRLGYSAQTVFGERECITYSTT